MLKWVQSRWWYLYLPLQAVGLFHLFYPLPFHYRHGVGRLTVLPLMPGGPIAFWIDWMVRGGSLNLHRVDEWAIGTLTLTINCVIFAVVVAALRWSARTRHNSWRKNADTFD
jgi:hypothetical protein